MKKIERIEPTVPQIKRKKCVAAYARVSMETDRLNHSLSAQISYYSELIQKNPEWEYAGVYADSFISGTSIDKRAEFQRMIADCEAGKINIIFTKSISRFARNTVDLLSIVRQLKAIGVEVRFEKENINSLSSSGEVMLSILASFAQEESVNISNNVKWGTRKRFEHGIPNGHFRVYGYRWAGDSLVIVPEEATIVRRIYQDFLDGKSRLETERELAADGIATRAGCRWVDSNIKGVLTNITYTGNMLFQKEFIESPLTHRRKKNRGELPQYLVENTHEPIIDKATFDYVQQEIARRKELGPLANKSLNITCFTGKIKCGICGKSMMRSIRNNKAKESQFGDKLVSWVCGTRKSGMGSCATKEIPDSCLRQACAEAMGLENFDEELFSERVDHIVVPSHGVLVFHFKDGTEKVQTWENTSKKDFWTEERKRAKAAYLKLHPSNGCYLSGKVRCGKCGETFGRQATHPYKDGTRSYKWRCRGRKKGCDADTVDEKIIKNIYMEITDCEEFSEDKMADEIDHISVISNNEMIFHFTDGREISHHWEKLVRPQPKHTEETKRLMSKLVKERWTDENRQHMSEVMKNMRREEAYRWQRQ